MNYVELYNRLSKYAAEVLTPEAEQAAMQGGGMPPQGGAPMDPAMAQGGAPMPPPQGGAPMDPAMMQGGGMPPQGAPMDPGMGGMPPQGGAQIPPEAMQDPQFLQMLQQMAGIMLDPNSGTFVDQQGQPVPPEIIMQAWEAYQQQMGGGGMPPEGGAPMDPGMGGMPPDAGMPPMPPDDMGGMPPEGDMGMPPEGGELPEEVMTMIEDKFASIEKREAILLKKLETLQASIDALQIGSNRSEKEEKANNEDADLNAALAAELAANGGGLQAADVPPEAAAALANKQAAYRPAKQAANNNLNLFSLISGLN